MELIDARKQALSHWLTSQPRLPQFTLEALAGDASFRRYFRVHTEGHSYVAMDAPPEKEQCLPFIAISKALRTEGLLTPEVFAADVHDGFLLLTDFGDDTYLKTLNTKNADQFYTSALSALATLQACRSIAVPRFTEQLMWQEMKWYQEWFLTQYLQVSFTEWEPELHLCYQKIIDSATQQTQVFMHRDYHSANLMMLQNGQVGILDFQDAFIGPVTYDLVSLLRDCYIAWPQSNVAQWVKIYWQNLKDLNVVNVDADTFVRWFDWMGVQRHLKVLFTFSRKHVRDNNPHYLQYIPRTLHYLIQVSKGYEELQTLHQFLQEIVLPANEKALSSCVE